MANHNAIPDNGLQKAMKERRKHQKQTRKQERQDHAPNGKVQRTDNKNARK